MIDNKEDTERLITNYANGANMRSGFEKCNASILFAGLAELQAGSLSYFCFHSNLLSKSGLHRSYDIFNNPDLFNIKMKSTLIYLTISDIFALICLN